MTSRLLHAISSLTLLLVLATGVVAYGGAAPEGAGDTGTFIAEVDTDGVQRVAVIGGSYFFRPERFVVKAGVPVELTLVRDSLVVPHNFVIDPASGLDIEEALTSEPKTIRFVPRKTGEFRFYCDRKLLFFKAHREKGMEGVMEVVD